MRAPHVIVAGVAGVLGLLALSSAARPQSEFAALARSAGTPQVPGLTIVYLTPLGDPAKAPWRNIIVHQTEGPPNSARALALAQQANPGKRGVTLWVETDGTVYWATPETTVTTHGDGANRNDNKYIDNSTTYRRVIKSNSIGVEFVGNYPDVRKPASAAQERAWRVLVRFLQERYAIPVERVYAHNWIDYKDARYCEGCELAQIARAQAYVPGGADRKAPPAVAPQRSDCELRLGAIAVYAVYTAVPALAGPGLCGASDAVRLEAIRMPGRAAVSINPPAILRCTLAEAVAHWVRDDLAPAAARLGSDLAQIVNYDSYSCRGRNRLAGAKLSEHGRANALDIRALGLASGVAVEPTDPKVSRPFREAMRRSACARFTTVLGPGSDGFHENHVHVDLAERRRDYRMCRWDLREPAVAGVPLPRRRPLVPTDAKP